MSKARRGAFGRGREHLAYEAWNEKQTDAPPLVLVHGLSGSGRWWRYNVGPLSESYAVYVVDLIGYGSNRAWRPATIGDAAETLAAFVASLPGGRANVIGHSMGGHISATFAARYPHCVDRLVLAAASGLVRSQLLRMALRLPVAARYSPLNFFPTLALDALRAGPLNLLMSTRHLLGDDITESLPKILAPTLLIWGSRDNLVPPETGQTMEKIIPDARLHILKGGGHVVMWDHATDFNRLTLEFLAATPRPAQSPLTMPASQTNSRP